MKIHKKIYYIDNLKHLQKDKKILASNKSSNSYYFGFLLFCNTYNKFILYQLNEDDSYNSKFKVFILENAPKEALNIWNNYGFVEYLNYYVI